MGRDYHSVNQNDSKTTKSESKATRSCCSCKCWCFTCCILLLIVIGIAVGLYFVLSGIGFFSANKIKLDNDGEWDKKLMSPVGKSAQILSFEDISGEYELVSFDKGFENFLKAMGIPFFVLPIILSTTETLHINATHDGKWSITRDMGFMKKTNDFELEEEFELEWGRKSGIMHSTCSFEAMNNTLICISEEKAKGWNFVDKMIFSELGMINDKYFKEDDIRAKKYYQKKGLPEGQAFDSPDMPPRTEPPVENSPFSSEDDGWDNDGFFDFDEQPETTRVPNR